MSWRVCSTPGCPNLIETPARKCDACTRAQRDRTRTRGRNPYNTKGHQSFRGRCSHETHTAHAPATPSTEAAANTRGSAENQAQSRIIIHTSESNS